MTAPDHLEADIFSAPGGQPVLVVDASRWRRPEIPIQAVVIGIDRNAELPAIPVDDFDLLLTTRPDAPRPWVSDPDAGRLTEAVCANPLAATIAASVLRLTQDLSLADALSIESLAYSTLLGGGEFTRWRAGSSGSVAPVPSGPVHVTREDDQVMITLNDPANRNAMSAPMRDALYTALANVLDDPTAPDVRLAGAGKCFSTGGLIAEFGTARDLAQAHAVRMLHSCARALDSLGARGTVRLHGACVGSGIEVAAAAHGRIATADAWFQLPEVTMGLIPGAGGTVTVPRAIGRHRTLWLLLSGRRINARQALGWGLIHAIEDRS